MASSIRAMPEKEKQPAMRVDLYYFEMALDYVVLVVVLLKLTKKG